jgi:hypothetical protein
VQLINPIAVLSFNRANDKDGLTHKLLTKMKIQHNLFIEPQHEEMYKNWYNPEYCELIICPRNFSEDKMGSCRVRTYICEYFNTYAGLQLRSAMDANQRICVSWHGVSVSPP